MIDMHTHVLPGVDDGAADGKISAEILRVLSRQGVDGVVFTPHYYGRKRSPKDFLEARAAAFSEIKDAIPENMDFRLGAEVRFTAEMPVSNEALCPLAIGDTRYILFEFPFFESWNSALFRRLQDFIFSTDYVPVIAHVERYAEIRRNPSLLSWLIDAGCLLQVNTGAFLDKSTKNFAFTLLRHGMIHCLGTDAHNATDRAPDYSEATAAILAAGDGARLRRIDENSRRILDDLSVKKENSKAVKKLFGRFY